MGISGRWAKRAKVLPHPDRILAHRAGRWSCSRAGSPPCRGGQAPASRRRRPPSPNRQGAVEASGPRPRPWLCSWRESPANNGAGRAGRESSGLAGKPRVASRAGVGDLHHGDPGLFELALGVVVAGPGDVLGEGFRSGSGSRHPGSRRVAPTPRPPRQGCPGHSSMESPPGAGRPGRFVHGQGEQGGDRLEEPLHLEFGVGPQRGGSGAGDPGGGESRQQPPGPGQREILGIARAWVGLL